MYVKRLKVKNWRNFKSFDIPLRDRVFIVGPNACGKSNFLDIFRFLHDIADHGLQKAVDIRGGISKIRCLYARKESDIEIEAEMGSSFSTASKWTYKIQIKQLSRGLRHPYVESEVVREDNKELLNRPDQSDQEDSLRTTQTHLEQINTNQAFREIANFFKSIEYLHLVPQLLRQPQAFSSAMGPTGPIGLIERDPYGRTFLEAVARASEHDRKRKLGKIEKILQKAVPQLEQLNLERDENGIPHLNAVLKHWRPDAGKQREDQFSDGTLRLIGLLWSLLENDSLLLLEEPELSLHEGVIRIIPALIHQIERLNKKQKKQIILSTHSSALLSDMSIASEEVILMTPTSEGTSVEPSSNIQEVQTLLEAGLTMADVVLPRTSPKDVNQLSLSLEF